MPSRRDFLKTTLAASATFPLPLSAAEAAPRQLRIGLITDVHKDLVPDADERLKAFVDAMTAEKADALIELGDFCQPRPSNRAFADIFNRFSGPKFHVIGNHEMDGGFTRDQVVAFHGMPGRFYSFDLGGFHFIVLDGNDRPEGWKSGYPHFIAADQVDWLKQDLEKTPLPVFVLSHQSLERPACIDNQQEIRALLASARLPDGRRKVAAAINGHWHIDHHRVIDGVPYLHLNSASYYWLGSNYKRDVLAPDLAARFPVIASTALYSKPLFTVLEIDPAAGFFSIRASDAEWTGPSPEERGYRSDEVDKAWVRPAISPHRLTLG